MRKKTVEVPQMHDTDKIVGRCSAETEEWLKRPKRMNRGNKDCGSASPRIDEQVLESSHSFESPQAAGTTPGKGVDNMVVLINGVEVWRGFSFYGNCESELTVFDAAEAG